MQEMCIRDRYNRLYFIYCKTARLSCSACYAVLERNESNECVSGYRSYERQKSIYSRNVALHGKKATDSLSAKPGSSEHQTGLTIDVSASSVGCLLTERFGSTKEGRWLAKNAHKYPAAF